MRGGDAAALLVALAEIEEALGRFDEARVTIAAAIVTLEGGDYDLTVPVHLRTSGQGAFRRRGRPVGVSTYAGR